MSRKRLVALLIAMLIVGVGVGWLLLRPSYGLLLPISERNRVQLVESVQRDFQTIPVPDQVTLVHQKYYSCPKCLFAGTMALYATDLPWETVRTHYIDRATSIGWDCGKSGANCRWPYANSSQEKQFNLNVNLDHSELWYSPVEASRLASATGKATIYLVQIVYFQDKAIYDSECPAGILNVCESEWWQDEIWPNRGK